MIHQRSLDARVGVAPVLRRAAVPRPRFANAVPSSEPDLPINHENAPMVAVIVAKQPPDKDDVGRLDAAEKFDLASRLAHQPWDRFGYAARALTVQKNMSFDAGAAALGQCLRDLLRDSAILIQI